MGLFGIWIGLSCSWIFASLVYLVILSRIDWEKEADEAETRNKVALSILSSQNDTTDLKNMDKYISDSDSSEI